MKEPIHPKHLLTPEDWQAIYEGGAVTLLPPPGPGKCWMQTADGGFEIVDVVPSPPNAL